MTMKNTPDLNKMGKEKSEGLELLTSFRKKQVDKAEKEGSILPGRIVGVFGITPKFPERQFNPYQVAWAISPHRKDQRHGVIGNTAPMSSYGKELLQKAVPWVSF